MSTSSPLKAIGAAVLVVVVIALCAGVPALVVNGQPPRYTSSAQVLYQTTSTNLITGSQTSDPDVARTLATQAQVVLGDTVIDSAATDLGVSPRLLVRDTDVNTIPESSVLEISVSAGKAEQARARTEAVTATYAEASRATARAALNTQASSLTPAIDVLRSQINQAMVRKRMATVTSLRASMSMLQSQQFQLRSAARAEQGSVSVLSMATLPEEPSSISARTAAVLGGAVGLVLVGGLVLAAISWARRDRTRALVVDE